MSTPDVDINVPNNVWHRRWKGAQDLYERLNPGFYDWRDISGAAQAEYYRFVVEMETPKGKDESYEDELVAKIDQIYAIVRDCVSATMWEEISRRLVGLDDAPVVDPTEAYASQLVEELHLFDIGDQVRIGGIGPAYVVTKMAPSGDGWDYWLTNTKGHQLSGSYPEADLVKIEISAKPPAKTPEIPDFVTDHRAHSRIDALQREMAYQLSQIKVAAMPSHVGVAVDGSAFYEEILSTLKDADRQAGDLP